MVYSPKFIKPSRIEDESPELSPERIANNNYKGIETSIVLDLNVLSTMNDVMKSKITLKESGLQFFVSFLNSNSVFITPGFGLGEADQLYIKDLVSEYENFMVKYCPTYIDTPNSLNRSLGKSRSRKYIELEKGDRYSVAIPYMSMLAIQVIAKENQDLSPEGKFESYVNYMTENADMLGAIEAEVAKIWFFDRSCLMEGAFKESCKVIRDNFNKGGKGEGRLSYILNSARDLLYYRATAMQDGEILEGGGVQDAWLVTGDEALVELSKYIHFYPYDGCGSKFVAWPEIPEKANSHYWDFCDEFFVNTVELRRKTREDKDLSEKDWDKVFSSIACLEHKVRSYWPNGDTA